VGDIASASQFAIKGGTMAEQLSLFESRQPSSAKYSYFLALFPDPDTGARLIKLGNQIRSAHEMHCPLRPLTHLHISLHFFGPGSDASKVLVQVLDPICQAITAQTPPFSFELDCIKSFRGRPGNHPLVLVGDEQRNAALMQLHQTLEVQLIKNRLARRPNIKFVPHVTLLYDKQILAPVPIDPVVWRVEEMVLVRSEVGATKYEHPGRWILGG
jgi:2'-5' RNA ligase